MLVTTNDAFAALNGVRLPRRGSTSFSSVAYDAGSEANTENCSDIPGPPCGNPFVRVTAGAEGTDGALDKGDSILSIAPGATLIWLELYRGGLLQQKALPRFHRTGLYLGQRSSDDPRYVDKPTGWVWGRPYAIRVSTYGHPWSVMRT